MKQEETPYLEGKSWSFRLSRWTLMIALCRLVVDEGDLTGSIVVIVVRGMINC